MRDNQRGRSGVGYERALVDIEREKVEMRKGVQVVRVNFWI